MQPKMLLMAPKQNPYRIGRRAGQQGPRPLERNLSRVEKSATGTNSSNENQCGPQNRVTPNFGPTDVPSTNIQRQKIQKWTREEYKEIMYALYHSLTKPSGSGHTENT